MGETEPHRGIEFLTPAQLEEKIQIIEDKIRTEFFALKSLRESLERDEAARKEELEKVLDQDMDPEPAWADFSTANGNRKAVKRREEGQVELLNMIDQFKYDLGFEATPKTQLDQL